MKRYNFKTKKIYESETLYKVSLDAFDNNGKLIDSGEWNAPEDLSSTIEDAIEFAYDRMEQCANENGFDGDEIECEEDGDVLTCTLDGVGKWIYTVEPVNVDEEVSECGTVEECGESFKENDTEGEEIKESVAERFSRLRRMFESEEDNEENNDKEESDEDPEAQEAGEKEDDSEDKKSDDSEEDEDEEMKAVIITVKKGDEDKCKDELIDAGIEEGDIEILDADEDAENVDIRIDVNSVMELKDYLSKKGIDLEEEIGGEIVSDDEESDDEEKDDSDEDEEKEGEGDEEEFDFDNLGDIFGAEDEEQ